MNDLIHIFIYGDIANVQMSGTSEFGVVSLKSVVDQLAANPSAKEIVVHIHSRGGNVIEGFAIHDVLKNTGKKITTVIEGLCASIATVIALAGDTRQMTANSEFFIHCPMNGTDYVNADQMQEIVDHLREVEAKMLDFYVMKTGGDKSLIESLMKQETGLTADKALEMKFVTEIVTATKAKAVAIINPKTMTKNQTTLKEKFNAFLQKHGVKAVFDETAADGTGSQQVQSLDVKLKDGSMIHIETASADPSIGDTVSVNGAAAPDKTFELEDGSIIKTDANSKIADITPAPAAAGTPAPADNTAALSAANAEIKKLNDKIASIEAANAEAKKTEAAMRAELEENKTMFAKIEEGMSKLQESTGSDFKPDPEAQRFRQNETNAGDMRADVKSGIDSFRRTAKERADKKKGIAPAAK